MRARWSLHPEIEAGLGSLPHLHGFDSLLPDSSPARVLERDLLESLDRAASFRDVP